jgi:2,3-bisphosphoglycerate-dependent phosphoglycerate mutase
MNMGNLALVRHGITGYNQEKRFTGFIDVSITPEGMEQAKNVGRQLKELGWNFSVAYTSWLKRAWETLALIQTELAAPDLPVIKHPFLNERHYGELQGMLHTDIAAKYSPEQVQVWRRSYAVRPPNGECLQDVVVRTQYYLNEEILPRLYKGENILICAHGNSNRAIVKQLEQLSDEAIVAREIAYDVPLLYEVSPESVRKLG